MLSQPKSADTLPLRNGAAQPAQRSNAAAATKAAILVADDDPQLLGTLRGGLSPTDFEVIDVPDGQRAMAECAARNPALAVINHSIAGSNGVQLARQIAEQAGVPFIFLSARSDDGTVHEAIAAGALTYLMKPVAPQQLLAAVRTALQRAREIQALRLQATKLSSTLQVERNISIATGLLMEKFHVGRQEAFERLRRHARSQRARLEEVASQLLTASDQAGTLYESLGRQMSARAVGPGGSG